VYQPVPLPGTVVLPYQVPLVSDHTVPGIVLIGGRSSVLVVTWYYILGVHSTDALGPTAYSPISVRPRPVPVPGVSDNGAGRSSVVVTCTMVGPRATIPVTRALGPIYIGTGTVPVPVPYQYQEPSRTKYVVLRGRT